MSTLPNPITSIRHKLSNGACSSRCANCSRRRFLWGATAGVAVGDLQEGSALGCARSELSGRSILLTTRDQLAAALALIELDGIAERILICPPEIRSEQFPALIQKGGVDTIVSDYELCEVDGFETLARVTCGTAILPAEVAQVDDRPTEWVLLTSGTTSAPKMIVHNLNSLTAPMLNSDAAPIGISTNSGGRVVWGTFYDIRRYGGLQIFLRAVFGGGSLVLSSADETPTDHLIRLDEHEVTHLSGTPSHWRRALMSPEAHRIAPHYIRLSGEIADQAILNTLRSFYPNAEIGHAFASTEAGVAFDVNDGLAGFPAAILGRHAGVEMKIYNDSLWIRSNRAASRYLDAENGMLADSEGFIDTGDIIELRGNRYYFLGRRNGVINIGGMKVYPEEVEAVINLHPAVRTSLVRARRSPITGSLVHADVMLKEGPDPEDAQASGTAIKTQILEICGQNLAAHKVPATIQYVPSLDVAAAGKLSRCYA